MIIYWLLVDEYKIEFLLLKNEIVGIKSYRWVFICEIKFIYIVMLIIMKVLNCVVMILNFKEYGYCVINLKFSGWYFVIEILFVF